MVRRPRTNGAWKDCSGIVLIYSNHCLWTSVKFSCFHCTLLKKKKKNATANLITISKYIIPFSESKECVFIFKPQLEPFLSCLQFQLPCFKELKLKDHCTVKVHICPPNPDWLMITEYDIFHRVQKSFKLQ